MQISISNAIGGGGGAQGAGGSSFENLYSFAFDGNLDYITVPIPYTTIDTRDMFSISCWIKIPSGGGGGIIGKNNTASYNGKRFTFTATETRIEINTNTLAFRSGTLALSVDTWYSIIVSIDRGRATQSDRCRVYLDGSPLTNAQSSNFAQVTADASPLTIGTLTRGTSSPVILSPFEGSIDELAVWQTPLTLGNVTDIYNSGTPNDLSGLGIINLVNWYRMGDAATFDAGTATWSLVDQGSGGNNGTTVSMPEAARQTDTPT